MKIQPFEGLKIVGLVTAGVGPQVMRVFSQFGATAVRVESITKLDIGRVIAPYKDNVPGINRAGYMAVPNQNLYSLALDMNHPKSRQVVQRLINWADVVVENFRPGQLAKWKLSYDDIKKTKPDMIMLSLSQQGQTGPFRMMAGYGGHLQGLVGFVNLTGWPDRSPCLVDRSYPDQIGPHFGVSALIAALDYKRRTGKGQYIDISQYEACLQFLSPVLLDYTVNNRVQTRTGNRNDLAAPHGAYRCQGEDRWCAIVVSKDTEWKAFCRVIGSPPWAQEPRFNSLKARKENEDELNHLVEEWTIQHTAEDVMKMMQDAGVPAGLVRIASEVIENCPQLKHRHYFWYVQHPEMGKVINLRVGYLLSKTPAQIRTTAPCLGEHTEFVCKELLGIPEDEYVDLLVADVLR